MKLKLWNAALLTVALAVLSLSAVAVAAPDSAEARRAAMEKVAKLPLSFEPTANPSRFVAHSSGYAVSVGAVDTTIAVIDAKSRTSRLLSFNFDKPNAAAAVEAYDLLPGITNYYIGSKPENWRLGVKNYARLRARAVYPGVDVVYYGDTRDLEFDFVISAMMTSALTPELPSSLISSTVRGFSTGDCVAGAVTGPPSSRRNVFCAAKFPCSADLRYHVMASSLSWARPRP